MLELILGILAMFAVIFAVSAVRTNAERRRLIKAQRLTIEGQQPRKSRSNLILVLVTVPLMIAVAFVGVANGADLKGLAFMLFVAAGTPWVLRDAVRDARERKAKNPRWWWLYRDKLPARPVPAAIVRPPPAMLTPGEKARFDTICAMATRMPRCPLNVVDDRDIEWLEQRLGDKGRELAHLVRQSNILNAIKPGEEEEFVRQQLAARERRVGQ